MTIKQQGGIFGRNPTYNEVTVDTKVTTSELIADEVGIGVTSPTYPFELRSPNNSSETVAGFGNQNIANGLQVTTNGNLDWGFNTLNSRSFTVSTNQTERLRVAGTGSGDVTVKTGNLIIGTSGKGIDFSATSGTGTSELFDDYEEGTYDASVYEVGGSTLITATGNYIKVGKVVTVSVQIGGGTAGGAGELRSDLPFTASKYSSNTLAYKAGPALVAFSPATSYVNFVDALGSISPSSKMIGSDVGSGTRLYFNLTYITS